MSNRPLATQGWRLELHHRYTEVSGGHGWGGKRLIECNVDHRKLPSIAIRLIALLFVLLAFALMRTLDAHAGIRERVAVAEAEVRAAQAKRAELPNDFKVDALTYSLAVDHITALQADLADQWKELRTARANRIAAEAELAKLRLGAGESERRDAATDGNASEHVLAKQPDGVMTRPPVLSLSKPVQGVDRYEVTLFTGEDVYGAGWCKNCPKAEAKFCPGGGRLLVTKSTAVADGPQIYPAFRFRDAAGRSRYPARANGEYRQPKDADDLLDIVERNYGTAPAATTGSAGSMKTHGQIRAFMQAWRDKLGDGAEVRGRIDKTGDQRLSVTRLIHGEPWTKKQVCGKFGRVELSTTANLPLKAIGFTYRLEDDDRFTFDIDPLTFGLPSQGYGANGEAVGMDPITIGLSIIQIANALYQILNPQIDCILPGTMSFVAKVEGETLTIKFDDGPSIHVSAWLQFDLGIKQVTITPTNVHVGFDTEAQKRNWIRIDSRDFQVDDQ